MAVSGDAKQAFIDWFLSAKGLYDYRTGNYAAALAACRESRGWASSPSLKAQNLAIEAMALYRSGDEGAAHASLTEAKALNDLRVPGVDSYEWHDTLAAHILYREAEALLAAKKAD